MNTEITLSHRLKRFLLFLTKRLQGIGTFGGAEQHLCLGGITKISSGVAECSKLTCQDSLVFANPICLIS